MTVFDEIFAKAREEGDLEAVACSGSEAVKLTGRLNDRRGACPLCGGPKGSQRFSVDTVKRVWKCHSCGKGGDVIGLERELRGGSMLDAARRLVGGVVVEVSPEVVERRRRQQQAAEAQQARIQQYKARRAAEVWKGAVAAKGTLVEVYLRSRGLSGPWLEAMLGQLRFHGGVHHSGEGRFTRGAPAMVGLRMAPAGPTGGVHITYLAANGRGKADLDPAKKMLGASEREGMVGGVWLTPPDAEGPLFVGEGIESTGSAAQLSGIWPCRMVAALSLDALQGGWLKDKWGRVSVALPRADLMRPGFIWPDAVTDERRSGEVLRIAVDRDMSPLKVRIRKPLGGSADHVMSADERAQVCGTLATAHWRAAGASGVRVIAPPAGRDFNDELRARQMPAGVSQ